LISNSILKSFLITPIRQISFGFDHCLILTNQGKVASWGFGLSGCLGHGNYDSYAKPKYIENFDHICYIECGGYHNGALGSDHSLYTWGRGDVG